MIKSKIKFFVNICLFLILIQTFWGGYIISYAQDSEKEEESLFIAKKAFEDGFYEVSLGLLERFLKNYPASPKVAEINLLIGQCYFQQNKFLNALEKFEGLLNQPSARHIQDAVLYWIAEVHFRGNNFAKAISYYKRIVDEFPKSSYAVAGYYSLGWCLFQGKSFKEALEYFKIIEDKFPKESLAQDSAFKTIECLYNLKDYTGIKNKIKNYLSVYAKDDTKIPYLYFYLAEADYYLDHFNEAISEYSKVISSTGDEKMRALSSLGIGWAYLKLKQYKEAEEIFLQIKLEDLEKASKDTLLLGKAILTTEGKRYSEARDIYDQLLSTSNDPVVLVQAYLGKADNLYNTAEYKESINAYKEALAKVSDSVSRELIDKLHYGLAWAYLKEGEFKDAIEEFQKVATQSEDKIVKISAFCQIGDAYQNVGDYEKAIQTYDKILKDYPDSFYSDYVQYQLGLVLLKTSNYDGAILSLQTLKRNFPNSKLLDDASYALGLSYFQREDYNASKDIFEKFPEEFKESNLKPQAMYLLGTSLYNLAKFQEAIEVFKNIIRMYGQDIELVQKSEYEIADCYYQMGNEKEAMEKFKALRSKYPDSTLTPEVVWWLGEYYYRHNDLDLARRYFSSLIQDFPKSNLIPNAYYVLGSIYEEESNHQAAIDNFRRVTELGKSDIAGTASIAIADIYVKQDQAEAALKIYKEVAQDYSNLAHLIYPKIADIYRKIGNYSEAIDFYNRSLNVVPVREMGNIQFKIAEAKQVEGKFEEAIEDYLKVTYLYPENNELLVKSLLRVAQIYEDKENFKEALNIYHKIVTMDVGEAKYAQERIEWINKNIKK